MDPLARDGVCDMNGQCQDVRDRFITDGGQFTRSAAEDPTLTIVGPALALARYQPTTPPSLRWSDPPR